MNNVLKFYGIALLLSFMACDTDPCRDVVCGDFGTCVEGICICDAGYEQDSTGRCDVIMRDKFLGSYSSVETCNSGTNDSYTNTISESTEGVSRITISNFYNFTTNTVKATVDGANLTMRIKG
ncbi:MAG: hypothetical protein GY810_16735 [Aureispira sp.]|nr:hypothetical protein [Aureispira sp.]